MVTSRKSVVSAVMERVALGPDWRVEVSHTLPGGLEQLEGDVVTLFESSSGQGWRFGADEAVQIKQPVFFLSGTESLPFFTEGRDLIHSWLPHAEADVMPGANHLLHIRNPADAAARLSKFLKRHSFAGRARTATRQPPPSAHVSTTRVLRVSPEEPRR